MSTTTAAPPQATRPELSVARINLMRASYAFMGIGLVLVKWPLLPEAHTLPLYEGVTLALLTAMSLLAWLGLRYPVKMPAGAAVRDHLEAALASPRRAPQRPRRRHERRDDDRHGQLLLRRARHRRHPVAIRVDRVRASQWGPVATMTGRLHDTIAWPVHTERLTLGPPTADDAERPGSSAGSPSQRLAH